MEDPKPKPKHHWQHTRIDENDPPTDLDWTGYDGKHAIGRIRKEVHGLTKGKWHWAGWYPPSHVGRPPSPNAGYAQTARLAAMKVEEFWDLCKRVMDPR